MDIGALASSLTTALVPLLPYLLKAGDKAAEETGKTISGQSLEWAKSLWTKLKPKVEAKEAAQSRTGYSADAEQRRSVRCWSLHVKPSLCQR